MIEVRVFATLREGRDKITMMDAAGITCAGDIIAKAEKTIEKEKEKAMEEMKQEIAVLAVMAAEKIVEREIQRAGQEAIVEEVIRQARSTGWRN